MPFNHQAQTPKLQVIFSPVFFPETRNVKPKTLLSHVPKPEYGWMSLMAEQREFVFTTPIALVEILFE